MSKLIHMILLRVTGHQLTLIVYALMQLDTEEARALAAKLLEDATKKAGK